MDKRFFLALFLSLVVIAISQLLFPPVKPKPGTSAPSDSTSVKGRVASSTSSTLAVSSNTGSAQTIEPKAVSTIAPVADTTTRAAAETTTVITPKAIYKFSNIGAVPVSIVMRDYVNRSSSGGLVDLAAEGPPLLGYRLVTPTDTADLSRVPFALSRTKNAKGDDSLTYTASVKGHAVSIAYTISQDTVASYALGVKGHVERLSGQSYMLTELPRTL